MDEKVAKAELLITGYFAEHHVPSLHVNYLVEVCKKAFTDSKIANNLNLKKKKHLPTLRCKRELHITREMRYPKL